MFEDKDDVRHLFMCQTAMAISDGHGSTLNVVVYFFCLCFLDLFTKFVITKN